ncbi:MAG: lamin tail domain-containing protein [Patescibacteria group bacterium]
MLVNKIDLSFWKVIYVLIGVMVFLLYLYIHNNIARQLVINEVAFSQKDGVDWIEIYNPTMNNWSLKGMYISDKSDEFSKYQIDQDIVVPSKGWVVLYGEGYIGAATEQTAIMNFRIANGETIYLVDKNGMSVIDSMTVVAGDDVQAGMSIGRFPDGGKDIFLMSQPTLGTANKKDNLLNIKFL